MLATKARSIKDWITTLNFGLTTTIDAVPPKLELLLKNLLSCEPLTFQLARIEDVLSPSLA